MPSEAMKQIVYVEPEQFAQIRRQAIDDELRGIDPGAYWKARYPAATEIEFVVGSPDNSGSQPSGES